MLHVKTIIYTVIFITNTIMSYRVTTDTNMDVYSTQSVIDSVIVPGESLSGQALVDQDTKTIYSVEVINRQTNKIDERVSELASYAYDLSNDKDFVKTLNAECGSWKTDCVGYRITSKGESVKAFYGLCQLAIYVSTNRDFILSADFVDPYKQIDYCRDKYKAVRDGGGDIWRTFGGRLAKEERSGNLIFTRYDQNR